MATVDPGTYLGPGSNTMSVHFNTSKAGACVLVGPLISGNEVKAFVVQKRSAAATDGVAQYFCATYEAPYIKAVELQLVAKLDSLYARALTAFKTTPVAVAGCTLGDPACFSEAIEKGDLTYNELCDDTGLKRNSCRGYGVGSLFGRQPPVTVTESSRAAALAAYHHGLEASAAPTIEASNPALPPERQAQGWFADPGQQEVASASTSLLVQAGAANSTTLNLLASKPELLNTDARHHPFVFRSPIPDPYSTIPPPGSFASMQKCDIRSPRQKYGHPSKSAMYRGGPGDKACLSMIRVEDVNSCNEPVSY